MATILREVPQADLPLANLARACIDDFNRDGVDGFAGWWHPDVVFVDLPEWPGGGRHHGRATVVDHFREFFEIWDDPRLEVREVVEGGEKVAVRCGIVATGRASGVAIEGEHWQVATYREGRASLIEAYGTREQALAALDA